MSGTFDNTIQNNRGVVINIVENSYARIGFLIPPVPALRPNTIRNNQGPGVHVGRASSAWIIGNTIAGNKGSGVVVNRHSQADIAGNNISGNSGDAISVSHNSGVNLKTEGTPRRDGPNQTDPAVKNSGMAIRCSIGGYVDGPLGTLAGSQGVKEFDGGCVDRLAPQ